MQSILFPNILFQNQGLERRPDLIRQRRVQLRHGSVGSPNGGGSLVERGSRTRHLQARSHEERAPSNSCQRACGRCGCGTAVLGGQAYEEADVSQNHGEHDPPWLERLVTFYLCGRGWLGSFVRRVRLCRDVCDVRK